MDIIRIKNAVFYAYHGVASDEQSLGGHFEVDVDMRCDLAAARTSDNLNDTVNYEAVYAVIQRTITSKKFFLLEALAESIGAEIMSSFPRVAVLDLRVRKPHPPVKGVVQHVEVEIRKERG